MERHRCSRRCARCDNTDTQYTGIETVPGSTLTFTDGSGGWVINKLDASEQPVDAHGHAGRFDNWTVIPDAPLGAIIGRIGANAPFLVPFDQSMPITQTGTLTLQMNDGDCSGCFSDNMGSVKVGIQMTRP